MKFGSVCSGIEAASVAWNSLGWEAAWLSEIEPFPSAVLKHYYPDVPNLGDMTTITSRIESGEVEAPDLFCGGTPCQAFSVAGLRKSLDDARGNLSLTFCEIADAIDNKRIANNQQASIIFWENVPGVLSTKDNAFGCFISELAGSDTTLCSPTGRWSNSGCVLGKKRTVAWRVLDAQYFGVARRRRRVFVIASAREGFNPAEVLFEFQGLRRDIAPSRKEGERVTPTVTQSTPFSRTDNQRVECDALVVSNATSYTSSSIAGYSEGVGTLRANGGDIGGGSENLVVSTFDRQGHSGYGANNIASTICSRDYKDHTDLCVETYAIQGSMIGRDDKNGPQGDGINREVCFTLNTTDRHAVLAFDTTQITSPANHSNPKFGEPCHPITALGHPPTIAFNIDAMPDQMNFSENTIPTLTTSQHAGVFQAIPLNTMTMQGRASDDGRMGSGIGEPHDPCPTLTKGHSHAVAHNMVVRRLTPVECERLQGFPDNYTNIPWGSKSEAPDSLRYKALGNSWAVPVVRWIGERISEVLQ